MQIEIIKYKKYELGQSLHTHGIFNKKQGALFKFLGFEKASISTYQRKCSRKRDLAWFVNGYQDHAHCLISIGREQSISKVAQLIKGESSYWINKNNLTIQKFYWQDDYWAVGVSEGALKSVRKYIHNQEVHHSKKSFNTEIKIFMEEHGWDFTQKKET